MNPRLDELLVVRGLFRDVHAAQAAVLAGEVVVGEHRETCAGRRLPADVPLRVKGTARFVGRGGEKLAAALAAFPVSVAGCNCVDLGASTGGFTDCLLQNGAARVAAVDVGAAQLDWRLRQDGRVAVHERTNVRGLDPLAVGGPFDVAVADLSFIPLGRVLEDVVRLLKPDGSFVSLVKPQFEVAKSEVGAGGVVRDPALHGRVLRELLAALAGAGLSARGLTHSPITGHAGNIEFLCWAVRTPAGRTVGDGEVERTVERAHEQLGGSR